MRSLLLITAAFAFLAAYLEAMSNNALVTQTAHINHKVIRSYSHSQAITHITPIKASGTQQVVRPLNLSIPSQANFLQHIKEQRRPAINWFKPRDDAEVTYNAELVFDAEKGEEITGGKVNIRIPLS